MGVMALMVSFSTLTVFCYFQEASGRNTLRGMFCDPGHRAGSRALNRVPLLQGVKVCVLGACSTRHTD